MRLGSDSGWREVEVLHCFDCVVRAAQVQRLEEQLTATRKELELVTEERDSAFLELDRLRAGDN